MAYSLTSGTKDAAHRRDVAGVVFALEGTLHSLVSGITDAPFHWSTKEMVSGGPISGYTGGWEPYLAPPQEITEELPEALGAPPPLHTINILVRNLPFRESESVLTAIIDGTWQWEGTDASLYAAYQRRGQAAAEIPAVDWITVRLDGQVGGPQNIGTDGFTLPLASREQVRRQQVKVREVTSGDFPDADPREYGKVLSTAYGCPDSWVTARRTDAGIFGLTTDAVVSGTQDFLWVSNDAGFDMAQLIGKQVYVYRGDKVRTVVNVQGDDNSLVTVHFAANLDFNIPGGSLVQEKITSGYRFAALNQGGDAGLSINFRAVAFEALDGRIVPLDVNTWTVETVNDANGKGRLGTPNSNPSRINIVIKDTIQPPALIPRLNLPSDAVEVVDQPEASVTQQPAFGTNQTIEATKDNYPTGPGFASAAFDGNDQTGYSVPASGGGLKNSVTFTFPSVTGNFGNNDTTRSILNFISQGIFQVTDGVSVEFLASTGSGKGQYRIALGSPEEFNQQVRFIEQGSGGIIYEIWWTHELEADISLDRTQDVGVATSDVTISSTGEAGYDMVPIKNVLFRVAAAYNQTDETGALPNHVFKDIQIRFLGESQTDLSWLNQPTYTAARLRYLANQIALHFVVDRQFAWAEMEADLALASRSYAFYGPSGHELHYIEDAAELEEIAPAASFNLPGTPNPNAAQSPGAPLLERTPLSQLVNTVRVYYGRNWLESRSADMEERFEAFVEANNAAAVALFGRRIDDAAPITAWPLAHGHDYWLTEPGFYADYDGANHVLALAQYIADRHAQGATRFTFDTGGEVVGVQRGDIVRVAWATAAAPRTYRNALCEVEYVRQSPMNANVFTLTCRTLGVPQKGLVVARYWTDLFIAAADSWADRFTSTLDRWVQYFGAS